MNRSERRRHQSNGLRKRLTEAKRQLTLTQSALAEVKAVLNEALDCGDQESAERLRALIDEVSPEINMLEINIATFDTLNQFVEQHDPGVAIHEGGHSNPKF